MRKAGKSNILMEQCETCASVSFPPTPPPPPFFYIIYLLFFIYFFVSQNDGSQLFYFFVCLYYAVTASAVSFPMENEKCVFLREEGDK